LSTVALAKVEALGKEVGNNSARFELAVCGGVGFGIILPERQDQVSANENQIVVYQPNETVRLDVRVKRGIGEREAA